MKLLCTYRCIYKGDNVKVGQTVEATAEDLEAYPVLKSSFVSTESVPGIEPEADASRIVVAGLTRQQAIQKLVDAGQKVSDKIGDKKLAERYNEQFGVD